MESNSAGERSNQVMTVNRGEAPERTLCGIPGHRKTSHIANYQTQLLGIHPHIDRPITYSLYLLLCVPQEHWHGSMTSSTG
eukprot:scaffold629353_cov39-Prasinocladus_malaysianus.AAC.1